MGENNINKITLYTIDPNTGEKIELSNDIQKFTIDVESIKETEYSTFNYSKEITLTCKNVILFKDELGKLYWMKTHVKSKRLKKKYNDLFEKKENELWFKYFGICKCPK